MSTTPTTRSQGAGGGNVSGGGSDLAKRMGARLREIKRAEGQP